MRIARLVLVSAVLACGGSSTPPPQPPSTPAGLAAVGGKAQVSLTWTAASGATSYNVLRGDAAGAETQLATSTAAAYTDASLPAAKTFFYVVQAVNSAGKSGTSNEASATTDPAVPAAPA